MGEDAARFRAGYAPANHATLNNIVLAVVFHRGFRYLPEANRHTMMRRGDALPRPAACAPGPNHGARRKPGPPPAQSRDIRGEAAGFQSRASARRRRRR